MVDYITGAAMMEPDVRIETNKQGFCFPHYQMMLAKRNRLGVALMLESHLDELDKQIFAGLPLLGKSGKKQGKDAGQAAGSCFICRQVDWAMAADAGQASAACGRTSGISAGCSRSSRCSACPTSPA